MDLKKKRSPAVFYIAATHYELEKQFPVRQLKQVLHIYY